MKKSKSDYKHKSVQRLFEEYQKHKGEMSKGIGFMSLMWRSIAPSVPELLKDLDNDPEMLGKIKALFSIMRKCGKMGSLLVCWIMNLIQVRTY